jgi:hypothetical protein
MTHHSPTKIDTFRLTDEVGRFVCMDLFEIFTSNYGHANAVSNNDNDNDNTIQSPIQYCLQNIESFKKAKK